jgi:ribosomal protein S18 acetylase RimI-like enzyme
VVGLGEQQTIRRATADDSERICELVYAQPDAESVKLTGSVERAWAFGRLLMEASPMQSWHSADLAELDGNVVGVVQHGTRESDKSEADDPRFLLRVGRAFGVRGSVFALPRGLALQKVRLAAPAGSWLIGELHVDAAVRGRGVGGALLAHAETAARAGHAPRLALTTRTNNPARRLYERAGFEVVSTRTHPRYERYTGAEGRVLMVKEL